MNINRITKIIQTEATTPSIGDFLITHVPFENLYLDLESKKSISENKLLNDIILSNHNEHKFILVQGSNGSGKSHLIRWIKEKYIGKVDSEKEAVLLISRAHNTLQDALTQLLEAEIFPEEIRENELKAIKNAKSNITGKELKKTINFNFTLEIDSDGDAQGGIIDFRIRNWLSTYLKDNFIQNEFLLIEDGPIERIRAKIETVNEDEVNIGDNPMFLEKDFSITLAQISKNLKIADGRAADFTIRLAEKFADPRSGAELRQKVADYLNTKVSNVIQRSMKLQTADFKKLFASLRKILKKQGMNLTLFVEDINSFTGIDEALMEVLLTDHTAEGNHDYCRIISVVGSTNAFYRDKLNASIKERIKSNIYIQEKSVLGNKAQLTRFAAKYINAINITSEQVYLWVKNGANDDEIPIYECEHKWADVDCYGNKLSIYPFNETALWKLYDSMPPEKKTPRVFLKSIIAHVLKLWCVSPATFLADENNFINADISIPRWESPLYNRNNIEIDKDSATERGILLKLWGNGTVKREAGLLGGLTADVFTSFNVYADITGMAKPDSKEIKPIPEIEIELPIGGHDTKQKPIIKPSELMKIEDDLYKWLNKKQILSYHAELRELLQRFIVSGIDWNAENVPMLLVNAYINQRSRIHIEGQNIAVGNGLVLERNEETYYLLIALANWKYAGNNTWRFEDSTDYLLTATAWLEKYKKVIVNLVNAPKGKSQEWDLALWNVAALYCIKTLFGGVDISKSSEDIAIELFGSMPNYTGETIHSIAWRGLQKIVLKDINYKENIPKDALAYFSKSVGGAEAGGTRYKFVDALEIIKQIRKLKALQWNLENLCPTDIADYKNSWYYSANFINLFLNNLSEIMNQENTEAEKYLNFFNEIFDKNFSEQSITESINAIKEFLQFLNQYLNLNYDEEDYKVIKFSTAPNKLYNALNRVKRINETQKAAETLMKISKNPFDEISKFYVSFLAFNNLLNQKETVFDSFVDTESKSAIDTYKHEINIKLDSMISDISNIGGVNNADI